VTYLPIAGHHPYESPERGPFDDRDEFGRYRNALHYADLALGDLRHGLESRGLDTSTLWVVYGDHGEAFGQHDGNFGHTFHVYDENVHVPLLVALPGALDGDIRRRAVASLIDTAPTLLDLLGVPALPAFQGRSLLHADDRMALFYADYSRRLLGLRDGPFKSIYDVGSGRSQLFDLDRDPHERVDLTSLRPEDDTWYARRLRRWFAAAKRSG
jgi:arylsulfatase A-like enzyme